MGYDLANINAAPAPLGGQFSGQNTKERERAAIDGVIATMSDRLQVLGRLIESVEIRFNPVCRPSPAQTNGSSVPSPAFGGSALATMIGSQVEDAQRLAARLEDLLSRCEL
jgi:hypothetical protein